MSGSNKIHSGAKLTPQEIASQLQEDLKQEEYHITRKTAAAAVAFFEAVAGNGFPFYNPNSIADEITKAVIETTTKTGWVPYLFRVASAIKNFFFSGFTEAVSSEYLLLRSLGPASTMKVLAELLGSRRSHKEFAPIIQDIKEVLFPHFPAIELTRELAARGFTQESLLEISKCLEVFSWLMEESDQLSSNDLNLLTALVCVRDPKRFLIEGTAMYGRFGAVLDKLDAEQTKALLDALISAGELCKELGGVIRNVKAKEFKESGIYKSLEVLSWLIEEDRGFLSEDLRVRTVRACFERPAQFLRQGEKGWNHFCVLLQSLSVDQKKKVWGGLIRDFIQGNSVFDCSFIQNTNLQNIDKEESAQRAFLEWCSTETKYSGGVLSMEKFEKIPNEYRELALKAYVGDLDEIEYEKEDFKIKFPSLEQARIEKLLKKQRGTLQSTTAHNSLEQIVQGVLTKLRGVINGPLLEKEDGTEKAVVLFALATFLAQFCKDQTTVGSQILKEFNECQDVPTLIAVLRSDAVREMSLSVEEPRASFTASCIQKICASRDFGGKVADFLKMVFARYESRGKPLILDLVQQPATQEQVDALAAFCCSEYDRSPLEIKSLLEDINWKLGVWKTAAGVSVKEAVLSKVDEYRKEHPLNIEMIRSFCKTAFSSKNETETEEEAIRRQDLALHTISRAFCEKEDFNLKKDDLEIKKEDLDLIKEALEVIAISNSVSRGALFRFIQEEPMMYRWSNRKDEGEIIGVAFGLGWRSKNDPYRKELGELVRSLKLKLSPTT